MQDKLRTLLLIIVVVIVLITSLLPAATAFAKEEESGGGGVNNISMYQRASEVARNFATVLSPGSDIEPAMIQPGGEFNAPVNAGAAGGFLGYAEYMSDDSGIAGWLMSNYTASSGTITYDQLENIIPGEEGSGSFGNLTRGKENPYFQYAGYGEALTSMGLAKSLREQGMEYFGRVLATGIVMAVYLVANAAPFLFMIGIKILQMLNPFQLFFYAIDGLESTNLGIISGVAGTISDIYQFIQSFSISVLFPALLVTTVLGVLLFAQASVLKRFGRYFLRLFLLFAGLPIIAMTYTGIVNDLSNQTKVGAEYANYLVLSSYVDFENWARNTRLAVPTGGGLIQNPRTVSTDDEVNMRIADRDMILSINGPYAGHSSATSLMKSYGGDGIGDVFRSERGRTTITEGSNKQAMNETQKGNFMQTMGLLGRHITSAGYSGSQYDGEVTGQVQKIRTNVSGQQASDDEDADNELTKTDVAILKMFTLTSSDNRTWMQKRGSDDEWAEAIDWSDAEGLFTEGAAESEDFQFGDFNYHIYNAGSLEGQKMGWYQSSSEVPDMSVDGASPVPPVGGREAMAAGLSPLAMYNFLNTTFSDTGMTVYSPDKTVTDTARDTYASVTFGSSGIPAWTRWIENVAVMASMAALSIAYGLIMIGIAIKSLPRIVTGVFGTALGSLGFAAKLLISTLVGIGQIFGIIVLYYLAEMILMSLIMNMNKLTLQMEQAFNTSGILIEFARSVITTIIIVAFTWFMIRNAKIFKEMLEEVISTGINKFMSLLDTSTGGQGLSTAKTSGGRVGDDGKLSDLAREKDAGNSIMGGIKGALADAHDVEAQREQAAQELGMGERGVGKKISSRYGTAKDILGAKAKDQMKRPFTEGGGKSYGREMDAKQRDINRMAKHTGSDELDRRGASLGFKKPEDKLKDNTKDKGIMGAAKTAAAATGKFAQGDFKGGMDILNGTNGKGYQTDEHGNMILDKDGNALDHKGNPISPEAALGKKAGAFGSQTQMVDEETGALLNENGDHYTDEAGQTFYQDDDGNLVDENGNYLALDDDGILKPLDEVPGADGPVNAIEAAGELDGMRQDSDAYSAMKDSQNASHYGLDADGNVIGADGQALTFTDEDGNTQFAELDEDGNVVDATGTPVPLDQINGDVDPRGFDVVEDPVTGEASLQHAGDAAMKESHHENGDMSLNGLAKEAAEARNQADAEEAKVQEMIESGAPAYAVEQARNRANNLNAKADQAEATFNQAMKSQQDGSASNEAVRDASHNVDKAKQALSKEESKLSSMRKDGAPHKDIRKQEGKVKAARQNVKTAESQLKAAQAANGAISNSENSVSKDMVTALGKNANDQRGLLKEEVNKLDRMRGEGAPKQTLDRQAKRVDEQRQSVSAADEMLNDANIAYASGRSIGEVTEARQAVTRAEGALNAALDHQDAGVRDNVSPSEQAERRQGVEVASAALSQAQTNYSNMKQKPSGSLQQIDRASAELTQSQQEHAKAQRQLEKLQRQANPMPREERQNLESQIRQADKVMSQHRPAFEAHANAQQDYKRASNNVASAQKTVQRLQSKGASEAQIEKAQASLRTAKRVQSNAATRMTQSQDGAMAYQTARQSKMASEAQMTSSGRPLTNEAAQAVQATRDTAKRTMSETKVDHDAFKRASGQVNRAARVVQDRKSEVQRLTERGASQQDIRKAERSVQDANHKLKQAQNIRAKHEPGAVAYRDAEKIYKQTGQQLTSRASKVSNREVTQAERQVKMAEQRMNRASKELSSLQSPQGKARVTNQAIVQPEVSTDKAYTTLAAKGINSRQDYSRQVGALQQDIQASRKRRDQAISHMKELRASNRPARMISDAKARVTELGADIQKQQSELNHLTSNAHGLLKREGMSLPNIATKPVMVSGSTLARELEMASQLQTQRDSLIVKRRQGIATKVDEDTLRTVTDRLNTQKNALKGYGVKDNVLRDSGTMSASAGEVRGYWNDFTKGNPTKS